MSRICGSLEVERLTAGEQDRQHHSKARLSRLRSNLDLAMMLMDDDIVGDMQAQAWTNARGLRSKEGVEDARLNLGWDPWPVVYDLNSHVAICGVRT